MLSLCEVILDRDGDRSAFIVLFESRSIASRNHSSRTELRCIRIVVEHARDSQRVAVPLQRAPRPLRLSGALVRPYPVQPLLVIEHIKFLPWWEKAESSVSKVQVARLLVAYLLCLLVQTGSRASTVRGHTDSKSFFSLLFRSGNDKYVNRWGERGCISCRAAPRNGQLVMCQPCHDSALRTAPAIIEVPEDHENYKSGNLL